MSQPTRPLKAQLEHDLRQAMKARQDVLVSTLRMALTSVRNVEVAGKQARELSDDEVVAVLTREAKRRREAAEAFDAAGREDLASKERAEERELSAYLPQPLTDQELTDLVRTTLAEHGLSGPRQIGPAMRAVQAKAAGRADGGRLAAEVRRQLAT
ncbi:MAG TPA: GatB/YqeY domain-containing protein [Micromonosporaceae bacterium]|nr:GatB/YqeY domain-containing protein [Micromonosporaceae bacterium]